MMHYTDNTLPKERLPKFDPAELSRVAYELFMQDLRPFATLLGIDEDTMRQYSRCATIDAANQVDKGTTRFLKELATEGLDRKPVYLALKYSGYITVAEMVLQKDYGDMRNEATT